MSLLTRCPRCSTLYRVTPVQLQAQTGKVRCGRCMNVFDGFDALAVEQGHAASEPVRFEPDAAPVAEAPGGAPAAAAGETSASDLFAAQEHAASPASPDTEPTAPIDPEPPPAAAPPDIPAVPPRRPLFRKPGATAAWSAACAMAALILVAQAVVVFRSELAARSPALRTALTKLCAAAGCTVPLPHKGELVKIEASDIHMVDASRPQLVQLTATVRSYAGYYLAYPALDLVLTNANEHALARRIFAPEEYLDRSRDPAAGFAPNAEMTIALDLDTGDLNAAGFRLDLLPAPARAP